MGVFTTGSYEVDVPPGQVRRAHSCGRPSARHLRRHACMHGEGAEEKGCAPTSSTSACMLQVPRSVGTRRLYGVKWSRPACMAQGVPLPSPPLPTPPTPTPTPGPAQHMLPATPHPPPHSPPAPTRPGPPSPAAAPAPAPRRCCRARSPSPQYSCTCTRCACTRAGRCARAPGRREWAAPACAAATRRAGTGCARVRGVACLQVGSDAGLTRRPYVR